VPVEETWGAMAECVDQGLARWIGVSNFDRDLIERCMAIRHVDSVQNEFSLLDPEDPGLLGWLEERGVGYLAYGPLAYGLLAGAVSRDTTFDANDWRSGAWNLGYYERLFAPEVLDRHLRTIARLRDIADHEGISLSTLALRALVATPGVTAAIAGSRDPDHVRSNAVAGDARLGDETLVSVYEALSEHAGA
jgi:aryl-alcohol dehydrogenase-like predicted oxidoreductase